MCHNLVMTHEQFLSIVKKIASSDTSSDPEGWTIDNPLWGHCANVALLAQDYFGGELTRGSLEGSEKYKHLRSHFWNKLSETDEVDFTEEQFPIRPNFTEIGIRSRDDVLNYPDTKRRYELLKETFNDLLKTRQNR